MLLGTKSSSMITTTLRKRFEVSACAFLNRLDRMSLTDLKAHVMLDEKGSPFVAPYAFFELRKNGGFQKGKFKLAKKSKYPRCITARVHLFASREANMSALRAEWFEKFAFDVTKHRLEEFAAEHAGQPGRPLWLLDERELHELASADRDVEFFSQAVAEADVENAMLETEIVVVSVSARKELKHQATSSAHERLARISARRDLGWGKGSVFELFA